MEALDREHIIDTLGEPKLTFDIFTSNDCMNDFDPNGEAIQKNSTMMVKVNIRDVNDETPNFFDDTLLIGDIY